MGISYAFPQTGGAVPFGTLIGSSSVGREPIPANRSRFFLPALLTPALTATGLMTLGLIAGGSSALTPTYTSSTGAILPVTITEKAMSRTLTATKDMVSLTRVFYITGTKDPVLAYSFGPLIGESLSYGPGLTCSKRTVKPYSGAEYENAMCELTVEYTAKETNGESAVPLLSYEFGSESEHITTSIGDQVVTGYDVDNVGNYINKHQDQVDGVEVNAPILEVAEEHIFTDVQFNSAFRRQIRDAIQKVNDAPFRDYEAGEVLFVGCNIRKVNIRQWSATFNFRVRRNRNASNPISIDIWTIANPSAKQTTSITKKGWDYLWVSSTNINEDPSGPVKIRPRAYCVAKVYDTYDFTALNIGTAPLP